MESIISTSFDKQDDKIPRFTEQCKLLGMVSVPTFGIYQDDYIMTEQLLILEQNSMQQKLPENLKNKINNMKNKHQKMEISYFHITLNPNTFRQISNENDIKNFTRFNLLAHPYIFYNCELNKEHKSEIFCAAFTNNDLEKDDIIKETNENDNLKINPNCEMDDWCLKREVILHESNDKYPSLSPNNCSILINLNSQIFNFYIVVLGTYCNEIVKCFVGNYVFLPNSVNFSKFGKLNHDFLNLNSTKNIILKDLYLFKFKLNDSLIYVMSYFMDKMKNDNEEIKKYLLEAFRVIFHFESRDDENENLYKKELNLMTEYYYENLSNFIKSFFKNCNEVNNFAENFLNNNYLTIFQYIEFIKNKIDNILSDYIEALDFEDEEKQYEILNDAENEFNEEISPNMKSFYCSLFNITIEKFENLKTKFKEDGMNYRNKNIEILIDICNAIKYEEKIDEELLNDLDQSIREYLYYNVWVKKGKKMGVDDNFGGHSFLGKDIDKKYQCSDEERCELCQEIISMLKDLDDN